ncbi:UNVERIFIED_CONTAM: hypothetical protein GTU68_044839 [Idotea baltica]|nr:hypothetical protein [Idotea baltica]
MLESAPGNKITTAALAAEVGVSEAALYRHFPSKAKMFDALIDFIEESLFSRISAILSQPFSTQKTCGQIVELTLQFAEKNPGICRILTGDAIVGEKERLGQRSAQVMLRLETQLKQILREAELREGLRTQQPVAVCANQICAFIDGKILQYVRSNFSSNPATNLDLHWQLLVRGIF